MKAAFYTRTGPAADVLTVNETLVPDPGPDEVLVKVRASGVNPSDTKRRSGAFGAIDGTERTIPHSDGAGVIEAVGENVPLNRVGERVWVHNAQWGRPFGTAAEYVAVPSVYAVHLPESVNFAEGATFGIPLLTAYHAVMLNGPVDGKTVLVAGGAGAVGNYAVQIARAKGADVIATVSSDEKTVRAQEAGAHNVVNYRTEDVARRCLDITEERGVDHTIEVNLSANGDKIAAFMAPGGTVAVYGSDHEIAPVAAITSIVKQIAYRFFIVYDLGVDALEAAKTDLTEMMLAGDLTYPIGARFPLQAIDKAHEAVESGSVIGNVVVDIE